MNRDACFRQIERKFTHKIPSAEPQNRFFVNISINRISFRSPIVNCKFAYFRLVKISGPDYQLIVQALEHLPLRKDLRREFYRTRTNELLKTIFGVTEQLTRLDSGAPVLASRFISISHSEEFLAVLVSGSPCGIDVQVPDRELNRGKDWFYNDEERQVFGSETSEDELYRIWCAKEAFYKMKQGKIDDLRSDVSVIRLHEEKAIVRHLGKDYTVVLPVNELYHLAYCLESSS